MSTMEHTLEELDIPADRRHSEARLLWLCASGAKVEEVAKMLHVLPTMSEALKIVALSYTTKVRESEEKHF